MKAKYDFRVMPNMQGKEEGGILYPQLVTEGTKTLKDIMRHAAYHSGMNEATIIGVVTYLEDVLAEYLAEGYNVKLGEIGTFSASLKSRRVKDKKEIRAQSVHFDNVNFQASKKLRKKINIKMQLERVEPYRSFRTSSDKYTADQRFKLLSDYLDKNGFISCKAYAQLTGLLKGKATSELRNWYFERKIDKEGRAPHIVYLAKKEKEIQERT